METDYASITLPVLFEDEHLVVVDKPAGMLVHRSRVDKRARVFAMQTLRNQLGRLVYPVHRIDRPTSGVLLFALSSEIAAQMCEQFKQRTVSKTYEAIVRGHPPVSGEVDMPLAERLDRKTDKLARRCKEAQSAVTQFESLQSWTVPFSTGKYPHSRYSHVRIRPLTGRKHQIRRHFKHLGYPLVGDTTHGDRRHNRLFREQFGVERLLLVAKALTFEHPRSGSAVTVTAGVDVEFEKALSRLQEHDVLSM